VRKSIINASASSVVIHWFAFSHARVRRMPAVG